MVRIYRQKIIIVTSRKPVERAINEELQWFGDSLGLFNLRDKDKSCFRVFIELLKSTKRKQAVSSDDLAYRLNLTRGTVIHHINKLMESGIVVYEKKKYLLRVDNLKQLVEEIRKDIDRTCLDLREVAEEIDRRLGL
ncbi:MAG: HTH domain-containing protein [Nanoarchaeota archaeon]|nr:HTH domain-containing protein [Nanoarchaeota archaeon]MBU1004815.1 HTH domain-containing protein [Nanoarchaeota archaeon]MBU1946612.1 HTH domain-containing protein [Nanoarchaeota archaeon]